MYQMLESEQWIIGKNCVELIDRIPQGIHDEKHVEDMAKFDAVDGMGGDDPLDAARYGLKSRHSPGRKPLDVRVREEVERRIGQPLAEVRPEQYTYVMMQTKIVEAEQRKRDMPIRLFGKRRR